jgi:8-oxo-dGTP pyrophosphatase MutT (NUDIX family)
VTITREQIADTLSRYLVAYPGDADRLLPLREALAGGADVTSRKEMIGHVTAATVLIDDHGDVLHIRHKTLGKWLIPGGHLETADISLATAARRELAEETAVTDIDGEMELIDVDVHPIPANPLKGEGSHYHFDFRFLARVRGKPEVALQAEEVTDHRWMSVQPADYPAVADRISAERAVKAGRPES